VNSEACEGSDHVEGDVASAKNAPSRASASKLGLVSRA
jgi:hypothetical protein